MNVFSRIGLVSVVSMVGVASAPAQEHAPTPATAPTHEPVSLPSASGGAAFSPTTPRGRVLVMHFLGAVGTPECDAWVRNVTNQAAALAGTRHVFIVHAPADSARSWATTQGEVASSVYIDESGTLARHYKIGSADSPHASATIAIDDLGDVIFRHQGAGHADHARFEAIAAAVTNATRAPALAEYNLPKKGGPAVVGYDVVAYFTLSRAVPGRKEHSSVYRGVTYQFSTPQHQRLFAADPENYLPTYGGWCASAMGDKGTKVEISPKNFKVANGRLFLFYKDFFSDALKDWNRHEKEWEPAADANWKRLTGEDPLIPKE